MNKFNSISTQFLENRVKKFLRLMKIKSNKLLKADFVTKALNQIWNLMLLNKIHWIILIYLIDCLY